MAKQEGDQKQSTFSLDIHSPFFTVLPSHPHLHPLPLKGTWELGSSLQFNKWLIDTCVSLQRARDTKTAFPGRKFVCICPYDSHTQMRLREYLQRARNEWTALFHCPRSQPPAGHSDITSRGWSACNATVCLVPPAGFLHEQQWRFASTYLSLTRKESQGIHSTSSPPLYTLFPSTAQGASLLFLPPFSH